MTYAKIIADSISPDGVRLTTMEVRFHRFVLAEFNTHRVFSRNSASSRAIPVAKQIQRVRETPATPVAWAAEQRGMQGGEPLAEEDQRYVQNLWEGTASYCASIAYELADRGLHKSVTNRILEPFMWHTVVVTSTGWENFFTQRCSPLAQPEIRVAADLMRTAYDESKPKQMVDGEWHLPYVHDEDYDALTDLPNVQYRMAAEISAARCARVSYLTQDGKRDVSVDLELFQRLTTAQPAHWSPLEHVATPWPENRQNAPLWLWSEGNEGTEVRTDHLPRVGNLLGWRSLRTEVEARLGQVTFR